jgi:prepilin-type N-terminal cleavage/methylation domain-containing protein
VRGTRGFTLVELLIALAILGVLLSISLAGYRYARIQGAESAAIATLDAINKAQFAYMQTCGNQRYAPTLVGLGVPVPGSGTPFLSPDLTQADPLIKSGYTFSMSGTGLTDAVPTCTGATPLSGYVLTADPITPGISGSRFFGTNGDGIIFEDKTTFGGNMPETGAPPHGQEIR